MELVGVVGREISEKQAKAGVKKITEKVYSDMKKTTETISETIIDNNTIIQTQEDNVFNFQNIESFLRSLHAKEQRIIREFMNTSAYNVFVDYIFSQTTEAEVCRINITAFRVKEDFSLRFHGLLKEFKKGMVIHIPDKDSYTTLFLKHSKLERIL